MKVATPVSTLFRDDAHAREIIAWSDCLESRDAVLEKSWPGEILFHTDIQPIHHLEPPDWEHFLRIKECKPGLKVLSMHLAACCDRPVLSGGRFQLGGRSYGRGEMLALAGENISRIRGIFGPGVELAVENNNYYPTPAYEFVCDADFIAEIVTENSIRLLFDLAHAHVTSINLGIPYASYRDGLPLDALIQIHFCRYGLNQDGSAYDAHNLPGEEEFHELRELATSRPVEYLTVEYYKDASGLIDCLRKAKRFRT